jgi:vancomycin resistance protein YoaR
MLHDQMQWATPLLRSVRQRAGVLTFAALGLLGCGLVAAWALTAGASRDEVARNVRLAGHDIGGMSPAELDAVVAAVAAELQEGEVRVEAPQGGFTTDTSSLGVSIVPADTARSALLVGRRGAVPARVWGWALSFIRPREAPVRISIRTASVHDAVLSLDPGPREAPQEPSVTYKDGAFVAVAGKPGRGIDHRDVIEALPEAAAKGLPIVVEVDRGRIPPRNPIAEAERLAGDAQAKVVDAIPVQAGRARAVVSLPMARSWVTTSVDALGQLRLAIDGATALADVAELLPDAGDAPRETTFEVVGGGVQLAPGESGTACCAATAVAALERALFSPGRGEIRLALKEVPPDRTEEEARQLGIAEQVATFQTEFPAGQPRVRNIHHIADLLRGQIIEPGRSFSVNDFVGRRTREKGFVSAPVIEDGMFSESVGGGISQFATTLFNAAFFAGLEFDEYQSHSIYISRYPRGREATLSYPKPDLKIKNTTPYGVLIWPTYTGSSIRVSLYSTEHMTVAQTGQTEGPRGNCTRVRTERTRTYQDGRTEVDHVFATYRPGEGINC